mmetsp:Transcript_14275/g.60390  ORF Transcript_14275/g.60390 Transcript_14275/m.60390 type:complete len:511 (-) Transcript_14275:14-1546(-)
MMQVVRAVGAVIVGLLISVLASAFAEGNEGPLRGTLVHLPRPRDPRHLLARHLDPLRYPSHAPPHGEDHREHLPRDTQRPEAYSAVEVHVRVELPGDEVLVGQRNLLQLHRQIEQRILNLEVFEQLVAHVPHQARARVHLLVHPVPETHQTERIRLALGAGHALGDPVHRPNLLEHREHRLVGAAVRGSPQRSNPGGDTREGIRLRGSRDSHRAGARVLLVVRVEHQDDLEAPTRHGIEVVRSGGQREHHVHEILREVQIVAWVHDGLPVRGLVRERGERRHLPHASHPREIALGRVPVVVVVVVEGAEGADDGDEDGHGVRVVVKSLEEADEVLVDQPVPAHLPLEFPPLLARRQGAAEEQVPAVGHVAVLGDVLDGVPAVQEPASVAVDEGDGGCARRGGVEARVVGAYPGGGVEFSDVQERGARAVLEEGQFDHPAVRQGERGGLGGLFRHAPARVGDRSVSRVCNELRRVLSNSRKPRDKYLTRTVPNDSAPNLSDDLSERPRGRV